MKITNKQYAQSLFLALHGLDESKIKKEVGNFVKILADNGDMGKSESIISEFEKAWQKEKGIVEAKISSADKLDASTLNTLKDYIIAESGTAEVTLVASVDKNLLAGFILRFNDQILDGSAKNMISNLKKELIK